MGEMGTEVGERVRERGLRLESCWRMYSYVGFPGLEEMLQAQRQ